MSYSRQGAPRRKAFERWSPSSTTATCWVPFSAYAGTNSGIPIESLTTKEFRAAADELFGFNGTENQARTTPGWLTPERVEALMSFCLQVAHAYQAALTPAPSS